MGETFFAELAKFSKQFPSPELRSAINLKALEQAQFVVISVGLFQGRHPVSQDFSPVLGADLTARVGSATGGEGLPPDKIDLMPHPDINKIVEGLPQELKALKVRRG